MISSNIITHGDSSTTFDVLGRMFTCSVVDVDNELRALAEEISHEYGVSCVYDVQNRALVFRGGGIFADAPVWVRPDSGARYEDILKEQNKISAIFTKMRMLGIRNGASIIAPGMMQWYYGDTEITFCIKEVSIDDVWNCLDVEDFVRLSSGAVLWTETFGDINAKSLWDGRYFLEMKGNDGLERYWIGSWPYVVGWYNWSKG